MTVRELLTLAPMGVLRRDAETLLLHLLNHDRAWLHAHPDETVDSKSQTALGELLARRVAGEPLQYLTGHQEFFGLDLLVTPDVLIPRPETEHLVEAVLDWAQRRHGELHLLDIGTGSGAIALALAAHLAQAQITALDISAAALAVARRNAQRLGLDSRLRLVQSDLLEALAPEIAAGTRFDAIVSNPPYIPGGDASELAREVREYEPALALFAGDDGLAVYRRLIPAAAAALRPGGLLAMEFGYGQRDLMDEMFASQPAATWQGRKFTPDLQGIPRVVEVLRA